MVAGSLVLLGLSDLPYPPWLCGTVPIYPPSSREELTSALHCIVLSGLFRAMWRGVIKGARWSETERNETGIKRNRKSIGRWSSPGSPWDAALAPRVFRGCAGMFLRLFYGSLLCSGGDHWVVLGGWK